MSPIPNALLPTRVTEIQQRFGTPAAKTPASSAATFNSALGAALGGQHETDLGRLVAALPSTLAPTLAPTSTSAAFAGAGSLGFGSGVTHGLGHAGRQRPVVTGDDVIATATNYLGIPYRWGGTDPNSGLDCSALVQRVYRDLGVELPRVSRDQARQGTEVASLAEARPGDLLAFGSPVDHIGLYVGDNKMLHAPRTGEVVRIGEIRRPIAAIRRVLPDAPIAPLLAPDLTGAASGSKGAGATGIAGAEPYDALFAAAGLRHGFSPTLLAAIAKTESNFNPGAVSPVGAQGLMQFMPATARGLGIDPSDPAQAIDGAARYLRQQVDRFGSIELGLAAYNAGPGNVSKYGGVPPFTETRNYVSKVIGLLGGRSPFASPLAA